MRMAISTVSTVSAGAMNASLLASYQHLMACAGHSHNCEWLAQMLASWQQGNGALPDYLGLSPDSFRAMLATCFPGVRLAAIAPSGRQLDFSRMLEKQDLEEFLRRYAAFPGEESEWLIALIVAACLGSDHLWQDMGLWSRRDLSALLAVNFPELVRLNAKDMKWKKFLYKQLCEAEGLYVCRAPSCEVCQDYGVCFGKEE